MEQRFAWNEVEAALDKLLALPPERRAQTLAQITAGRPALRAEIESLLEHTDGDDQVLDHPAIAAVSNGTAPSPSLPEGTRIGVWRVQELIGRGGMGEVYRVVRADGQFEQFGALKLIRTDADATKTTDRCPSERQILAGLEHPGIARLLDGGAAADGRSYMVVEYVAGRNLLEHCKVERLGLTARLKLFLQVCDAVTYAHRNLVVHRDLKPSNIFVSASGQVKVLDFGVAKMLKAQPNDDPAMVKYLSPNYAAPEQLAGGAINTATDVYALGVTLYELVCGETPWCFGNLPMTVAIRCLLKKPPTAPSLAVRAGWPVREKALRGDIDSIVLRAMNNDPQLRYPDAHALAVDIERHLRLVPVQARRAERGYVVWRFVQRHWLPLAAIAAVFLALNAGVMAVVWEANKMEREAKRADAIKDFLIQIFKASDPRNGGNASGSTMTATQLLDISSAHITKEFANQPELEIELLGTVAEIYGYLHDEPHFRALQEQRTELARRVYGPAHPLVVQSLMTDAWASIYSQNYPQALDQLRQIDTLINQSKPPNANGLLRAQWDLAYVQALRATPDSLAVRLASAGEAREILARLMPKGNDHAVALGILASLREQDDDHAGACRLAHRAIDIGLHAPDRDNGEIMMIYRALGRCEANQGMFVAAIQDYDRSVEMARLTFGERHGVYWDVRSEEARLLHRLGERAAAMTIFDEVLGKITPDWKVTTDDTTARIAYAASLSAEGQVDKAIPLLEAALPVVRARPLDESQLRELELTLGDAYARAGRRVDARAMLSAAFVDSQQHDAHSSEAALRFGERWARDQVADPASSKEMLDAAEHELNSILMLSSGRGWIETPLAYADLARIALAHGKTAVALQASADAITALDHTGGLYDVRLKSYLWRIRGQMLLASGNAAAARDWAQKALDAEQQNDAPGSHALALARALLAATRRS